MMNTVKSICILLVAFTFITELFRLIKSGFKYNPYERTIGAITDLTCIWAIIYYIGIKLHWKGNILEIVNLFCIALILCSLLLNLSIVFSRCNFEEYIDPNKGKFKGYVKAIKSRRLIMLVVNLIYLIVFALKPNMLFILIPLKMYISNSCSLIRRGMKLDTYTDKL